VCKKLFESLELDSFDIVVRLDADFLRSFMEINKDYMNKKGYAVGQSEWLDEIESAEKRIMEFITESLFEAIGTSKVLILVRGINSDSFSKIIASLSGYIKKKRMMVRVMTIVSSQTFAYNFVKDKYSFSYQLLNASTNFKADLDAKNDLSVVATD